MTDKVKLVVSESELRVEDRDGIKTCVFVTEDGREVLFQRNKQGGVMKVTDISVECFTLCEARKISISRLPNHFLEKSAHHSLKIVHLGNTPSAVMLVRDAQRHALRIDPHQPD